MLYPRKVDMQNSMLIKIIDVEVGENGYQHQIRTFWTEKPLMFLEMYNYMYEHDININFEYDGKENDPYIDKFGIIEDIELIPGGSETINCLHVYVSVVDWK